MQDILQFKKEYGQFGDNDPRILAQIQAMEAGMASKMPKGPSDYFKYTQRPNGCAS